MDSETIKKLMLEKIFDVFAPKIIGYNNLLNNINNTTWTPTLYNLEEMYRNVDNDIQIRFSISLDESGKFQNCTFNKTVQQRQGYRYGRRAMIADLMILELPNDTINLEFIKKETAIREISKNVDVAFLIKLGISAMKEIESHEKPENMSIGAIKKILNISPDIDLSNLETRNILLEFVK